MSGNSAQSCGELMYGDWIEKIPGALRELATELGGQIIAGPAATSQLPSRSPTSPPTPGPGKSLLPAPGPGRSSPSTPTPHDQWLELCVPSGKNTFVLSEIDLSGPAAENNRLMFGKIAEHYQKSSRQHAPHLFGLFRLRVPTGAVFVAFLIAGLAKERNQPPTLAVVRQGTPTEAEAARDHYTYDQPRDLEPLMPPHILWHYIDKLHAVEPGKQWFRRVPKLVGPSLYYGREPMARGWGIKIVESRNKILVNGVNFVVLGLTGLAVGLYAWATGDVAVAVAIGAYLMASETLVIPMIFWHWEEK